MFNAQPDTEPKIIFSYEEVENALRARRDKILLAFETREAQVTWELLNELSEINIALGEA